MKTVTLNRWIGGAMLGAILAAGAPALKAQTAAELNSRGLEKTKQGDYGGAVDDFTAAIALQPEPGYFANRAVAETREFFYDGALNDYTQVIKARPTQANGYLLRGLTNLLKGDMDSANKDYSKAIELQPKNATLFLYRGIVWDCENNQQGAVEDFSKAAELGNADNVDVNYAELYRALDLRRKGPDADLQLGDAEKWKNTWTKSLAAYLTGKLPEANLLKQAGTDAADEPTKKRERAEAYYFAGRVHEITGENDEAKKDFAASAELQNPTDVEHKLSHVELDRMPAH